MEQEVFTAEVTKHIDSPVAQAYTAFHVADFRRKWLSDSRLLITSESLNKQLRGTWGNEKVDIEFTTDGTRACNVTVTHSALASEPKVDERERYWTAQLEKLERLLRHS